MSKKPGIIINRMYAGDYLTSNLGHEIINLFQADNGNHYLYLNSSGNLNKEHEGIDIMLMVKTHSSDTFEVIGLAKGLHLAPGATMKMPRDIRQKSDSIASVQRNFINSEPGGVTYGNVSILDIFNDAEQQNIFITFKADSVLVPSGCRIFLQYNREMGNRLENNSITVALHSHNIPRMSLKSYIYPESGTEMSDYSNIMTNIVNNDRLWTHKEQRKPLSCSSVQSRRVSLFDICKMRDDENRISNAIAYFMSVDEYKPLWKEFFACYGINLDCCYTVSREISSKIDDTDFDHEKYPTGGRIDILVEDTANYVVIENKIKSGINNVQTDGQGINQLHRYLNFANTVTANTGQKPQFFIFAPNYNIPHLDEKTAERYRIVTYREVCTFLEQSYNMAQIEKDINFLALYDVMKWHTFDTPNEYLYYEMFEKFQQRLKSNKSVGNETSFICDAAPDITKNNIVKPSKQSTTNNIEIMSSKIKVRAKAQNRIALGVVAAYAKMFPNATIEELRETFPNSLAPDKGVPEMFISEEESLGRDADGGMKLYFSKPEEMISLGDGNRVALCTMWTGKSLDRLTAVADELDIEIEKVDKVEKSEAPAGYILEYKNGWTPPTQTKKGKGITVTPTTTVADIKAEFNKDFGAALKVYNGRNVAADADNLVSLGAKTGVLECRASRTVGSFIEEAQARLGLTVTVWTANEWVKVIDGVTLAKIKQLPKQATKADMEGLISYKR